MTTFNLHLLIGHFNDMVGQSEMYSSAAAMEKGVKSVKANRTEAGIKDLT